MLILCRNTAFLALIGLGSLLLMSCTHEKSTSPIAKSAVIELYQLPNEQLENKLPRKISVTDAATIALLSNHFKRSSGNAVPPGGWIAAIVIRFNDGYNTRTINSNYEFWWEGQSSHHVKNPTSLRKLIEQEIQKDELQSSKQ